MTRRGLNTLVFAGLAAVSVLQAQGGPSQSQPQVSGQGQAQPQPERRGQASDEANRGKVDQVKAGHEGFVTIFDGTSMKGWTVSAKSRHSNVSKNTSGGTWAIRDGILVGSQNVPGNGGLFITDRKYGDFEVALDMRNDFGMDSGIYLRSTDDGMAYQIMIDYRTNGSLAGVYGENSDSDYTKRYVRYRNIRVREY